jgi:hypothetical protein
MEEELGTKEMSSLFFFSSPLFLEDCGLFPN